MLLKISEQIADCLARAADARERAQAIAEPKIKAMYLIWKVAGWRLPRVTDLWNAPTSF
jgi:hypothetical protein